MSSNVHSVYRFAGFVLDTRARRLTSQRGELGLQPRPFALLKYLIEHRERVVPREELLREVWGSHVGPQAVGYAIHSVRRALDDDGTKQRVLRTVRGRGFQFVASIEADQFLLNDQSLRNHRENPPFLGRDALLEVAGHVLDEVQAGQGCVLALEGEAGIGKSRAIEQLASMALRSGFSVIGGRSAMGEGEPAFSPWRQVIRAVAGPRTVHDLADELGVRMTDLAWIAAPMEESYDIEGADPWRNESRRARLFDHVAELIVRSTRDKPVFLYLDDIHRSDPASLALLAHLAPLLCREAACLVVSFRRTDRLELNQLLDTLEQGIERPRHKGIKLEGLRTHEIKQLIELLTNVEISLDLAQALEQRTSGNPFFTLLLIKVLEAQGRIGDLAGPDLEALALPEHVHDAVLLQLNDLKPETVETLEFASMAGREFRFKDLAGALTGPGEKEVGEILEPALRAHVLDKVGVPGSYRFVHALVQESIRASLKPGRRAAIHARLARSIEAQVESTPWLRASELAHHFLESASLTGTEPALHYLEAAADWASLNMGFEDAAEFLGLAVEMRSTLSSVACECRLLIKLGAAQNQLGRRDEARASFLESAALAGRAGLSNYLALSALAFAPDFFSIETGVVDPDQVALLKDALRDSVVRSVELRSQLAARLGVALHWSDSAFSQSRELAARGVSLSKKTKDQYTKQFATTAERFATFSVDQPRRLINLPSANILDAEPAALLIGRVLRVTGLWLTGQLGRVRDEVEEFAVAARQLGEVRAAWYALLWRAAIALMEGDCRRAYVLQERFSELGARAADRNAIHSRVLQSFLTSIDASEVEPFGDVILEMIEKYPRVVGWRAGRLHFATELDRAEEEAELFAQISNEDILGKPKRNEWYGVTAALAIAAARLRAFAFASKLYDALAPRRDDLAVIGYGSYCYGSVAHLLGLCAWAAGEIDLARTDFERAIVRNRQVGAIPALARVLANQAELEFDVGSRAQGEVCAVQSLKICDRLRLRRLHRKVSRLRERQGR